MLSSRASIFLGEPEFLLDCLTQCSKDEFDRKNNPDGLINMGTAVNSLCEDVLKARIDQVILILPGYIQQNHWDHNPPRIMLGGVESLILMQKIISSSLSKYLS